MGCPALAMWPVSWPLCHRKSTVNPCTQLAQRTERAQCHSQTKKALRSLGVGHRSIIERKVRESKKRKQKQMVSKQLLCSQQSLPQEEVGPCAGQTASRRKHGDHKDAKGNENRRECVTFLLAFKTLPDCILKSLWTKKCRLLANSRPYLWHPWCCNIKSQFNVKFYYSTQIKRSKRKRALWCSIKGKI